MEREPDYIDVYVIASKSKNVYRPILNSIEKQDAGIFPALREIAKGLSDRDGVKYYVKKAILTI